MKNFFKKFRGTKKMKLGAVGERIACEDLKKRGYKVIERNFWKPWGELDVVAVASDKTLVFVEVKTMRHYSGDGLRPEDQLTRAKLTKLQRTASLYAGAREDLIDDERGWRIDLVAIVLGERGKPRSVKHYENI
jgi:putative endonuclease